MASVNFRLLILEPYYGGSHQAFLEGLQRYLPFSCSLLTLPAHKWKWRMRLAAPYFAGELHKSTPADAVLCSTFLDVAALRGLGPAWLRQVPVLTYFHENQFAYPVQASDERDLHFALTNLTTALASDGLAFNSSFNLRTFLQGEGQLGRMGCDIDHSSWQSQIKAKAQVLPPGVDFTDIDAHPRPSRQKAPVIVWNHRWEHDKDPETFFRTLFRLDQTGVDFRLIVLGQSFRHQPPIFQEAASRLAHRVLHFGFAPSRADYLRCLKMGDLVVSTARHEFFGLAVIEAVRAGCRPLLPDRLSYPELFPAEFLYKDDSIYERLKGEVLTFKPLDAAQALALTDSYSWPSLAPRYGQWLTGGEYPGNIAPATGLD